MSTSTSTQADTQVTTIVQQIDAQGPVVVERISTQFADVACSDENARKLVEALHGGTAVTLSADGKTATFTPTGNLGYGEAYIAMALAAEALRNAGVTGCATPDQWKAVFLGGPLAAAGTTTTTTSNRASASSSSHFPGILALRTQGQGWGQIAKTTNVQLGQIVSSARSFSSSDSTSSDANLSPTGRSSAEMNESRAKSTSDAKLNSSSGSQSSTPASSGIGSGSSSTRSSSSDFQSDSAASDKDEDKDKDKNKDESDQDASAGNSANSSSSAADKKPSDQ